VIVEPQDGFALRPRSRFATARAGYSSWSSRRGGAHGS
jgi:hypothetical protein